MYIYFHTHIYITLCSTALYLRSSFWGYLYKTWGYIRSHHCFPRFSLNKESFVYAFSYKLSVAKIAMSCLCLHRAWNQKWVLLTSSRCPSPLNVPWERENCSHNRKKKKKIIIFFCIQAEGKKEKQKNPESGMLGTKAGEGAVDMIWSWSFNFKTLATESLNEDDQELSGKGQFPSGRNYSSF